MRSKFWRIVGEENTPSEGQREKKKSGFQTDIKTAGFDYRQTETPKIYAYVQYDVARQEDRKDEEQF